MESSAAVVLRWEVHLSAQEMHKGLNEDVDEQKGNASKPQPFLKTRDLESSNWKFGHVGFHIQGCKRDSLNSPWYSVQVLDTYEPRKTTVDAYMQDCRVFSKDTLSLPNTNSRRCHLKKKLINLPGRQMSVSGSWEFWEVDQFRTRSQNFEQWVDVKLVAPQPVRSIPRLPFARIVNVWKIRRLGSKRSSSFTRPDVLSRHALWDTPCFAYFFVIRKLLDSETLNGSFRKGILPNMAWNFRGLKYYLLHSLAPLVRVRCNLGMKEICFTPHPHGTGLLWLL